MNAVRPFALICIVMMLLALCPACAADADGFAEEPLAAVPGYYCAGQSLGGGLKAGSAAVQAITVSERLEDTQVSVECGGAPYLWSVECLEAPGRIVLNMEGGVFPDMLPAAEGLLMGAFLDNAGRLVLQFTGEIAYKAEDTADGLKISVRRELKDAREWFVQLDALDSESEPPEGYRWALNADLSTMVLLGTPMETQAEARAALEALPLTVPRSYAHVVRIEDGRLPPSYVENEADYYREYTRLRLGDMEAEGIVWGVGMRFLCWQERSGAALVARTMRMFGETHDELWLVNGDEQRALLTHEWLHITEAALSGSERYIAIIEAVDDMRLLYIYDTRSGALYLMLEEGLGPYTASYAWNGDKLYALNGDQQLQLLVIDPSLEPDDPGRVIAVREQPEQFDMIGFSGGLMYYVDEEALGIRSMNLETGETETVTEGDQFMISPDGSHMAVFCYEPRVEGEGEGEGEEEDDEGDAGAELERTGLKLINLETGESVQISSGAPLTCMAFSRDGALLHYGVEYEEEDSILCRLYTRRLGEETSIEQGIMRSAEFYPGSEEDTLVAVCYYRAEQAYRAITYELNIIR